MKFYYDEAPALVISCEKKLRKNSATAFLTLVNGCFSFFIMDHKLYFQHFNCILRQINK